MRKETMREQLFKEKLARIRLESEIRTLEYNIKYKELTQKMDQVERWIEFNCTNRKGGEANDLH